MQRFTASNTVKETNQCHRPDPARLVLSERWNQFLSADSVQTLLDIVTFHFVLCLISTSLLEPEHSAGDWVRRIRLFSFFPETLPSENLQTKCLKVMCLVKCGGAGVTLLWNVDKSHENMKNKHLTELTANCSDSPQTGSRWTFLVCWICSWVFLTNKHLQSIIKCILYKCNEPSLQMYRSRWSVSLDFCL